MATQTKMPSSIINRITKIPSVVIYLFLLFKFWVLGQIRQIRNIRRSEGRSTHKCTTLTAAAPAPIAELPEHITYDILSRLPLKSIFICKRVCKFWHDLILEPHFTELHLSRSPLSLFFYSNGHFEILEIYDPPLVAPINSAMKFRTAIEFPHMFHKIVASCKGSFLVWNWPCDDEKIVVCNPLRELHFVLPKPQKSAPKAGTSVGLGLGQSPSTHRYKVLRLACLTSRSVTRLDCKIFTIGVDDKWRCIRDTGQTPARFSSQLVFLNGALHWIGGIKDSRFICCFDMEKERFGSSLLPSEIETCCSYLGVMDNRLYLLNQCRYDEWKFWVMKDYRGFGSWTLEWTYKRPINCEFGFSSEARPLKRLKNGSLLMMFDTCEKKAILASFNPRTRELKRIVEYGSNIPWGTALADIPCFFSPMDAFK